MEINVLRASIIIYIISFIIIMTYPFFDYTGAQKEVLSYARWWFSQPNTALQSLIAKLGLVAAYLSVVGCVALLLLKKWGGYLFILSVLYLVSTESLLSGYLPQSSFSSNINNIAAISAGCIISIMLLSNKLEIFKHNKKIKSDKKDAT